MTPAEYLHLNQPRLSHPARSLYCLHLRRQALQGGPVRLAYPELGRALAVEDPSLPGGFSYQVNARQLTALIDELLQAGLLQLVGPPQSEHYHQAEVRLPLLQPMSGSPLPKQAFGMEVTWRPDEQFPALATLCGLLDCHYGEEELGEFIAYWLGRPDTYATQHQWMLKFIKTLKARRYVRRTAVEPKGYQQVAVTPPQSGPSPRALEMIAEAERLGKQTVPAPQGEEHE